MVNRSVIIKWLAFMAGIFFFILAVAGVFLPLLPTVPFLLLSAFFWAHSSQKFHDWLIQHRHFGPMIADWHDRRAIPLRAKILSTVMMALSVSIVFYRFWGSDKIFIAIVAALICLAVGLWVWRQPR